MADASWPAIWQRVATSPRFSIPWTAEMAVVPMDREIKAVPTGNSLQGHGIPSLLPAFMDSKQENYRTGCSKVSFFITLVLENSRQVCHNRKANG